MNASQRTEVFLNIRPIRFVWLAALLLALAPMAASVAAQTPSSGAITGQVVAEDGKALADVTVFLSTPGTDRLRGVSRTTTTDGNGNFQFANLADRSYIITAFGQKGYVIKSPVTAEQMPVRYRPGDNVTITMTRGGVITGRVANASGDPLINISVAAIRVRDAEGNKTGIITGSGASPRPTDDRGVYRLYGLLPGTYVVVANSSSPSFNGAPSPYYGETPTYHPSSTRDTAAEVKVASGDEATGIDIRYRGDAGHAVSGKVSGGGESSEAYYGASVALRNVATETIAGSSYVQQSQGESAFAIYGIPDGEYELTANRGNSDSSDFFYAEPRRVTIKGADVASIELRLMPMATVAGRVTIEKSPDVCDAKLKPGLEDLSVFATRDEKADASASTSSRNISRNSSADEKGEFKIISLVPGRYRLHTRAANENWFVKFIGGPPSASTAKPAAGKPAASSPAAGSPAAGSDLARVSLSLKSGEKFTGVTVTIANGGASLRGNVTAKEGTKLPLRLRVYLVPAEATAADDVLRYAERLTDNTGLFAFTNVAPGKYWLLARVVSDGEPTDRLPQPAAWDTAERAKLRKDAEAAKNEIELKVCQRAKDHVLRF